MKIAIMEAFFMVWFSGGGDSRVSFTQQSSILFSALNCLFAPLHNPLPSQFDYERKVKVPVSQEGELSMDRQRQCHQVLGRLTIICQQYWQLELLSISPEFFHFLQVQPRSCELFYSSISLILSKYAI